MLTPEAQIESLKSAIRELETKIERREGELVAAQVGIFDGETGEVDDLELVGLYELRRKFLKELQQAESR